MNEKAFKNSSIGNDRICTVRSNECDRFKCKSGSNRR